MWYIIILFILIVAAIAAGNEIKEKQERINKNIPLMIPGSKWIELPSNQYEAKNPYKTYGWAIVKSIKQNQNGTWWVCAQEYNKWGHPRYYQLKIEVSRFFEMYKYKV